MSALEALIEYAKSPNNHSGIELGDWVRVKDSTLPNVYLVTALQIHDFVFISGLNIELPSSRLEIAQKNNRPQVRNQCLSATPAILRDPEMRERYGILETDQVYIEFAEQERCREEIARRGDADATPVLFASNP